MIRRRIPYAPTILGETSFIDSVFFYGSDITLRGPLTKIVQAYTPNPVSILGGQASSKILSICNYLNQEFASFTTAGKLVMDATDSSGTPGNATINKPSGQVAVANGDSSVTVTNSVVSATSVVVAVLQDNTDAIYVRSVVPGAGTFTINLSGATSGARKVGFVVFN
jgi:hypothetical protein